MSVGFGILAAVAFSAALITKPADLGGPHHAPYFALNAELRRARPGRDVALLDLDNLEHNVAEVRRQLDPRFALRLVTKSLPSRAVVAHLMTITGTDRLMVFNEGFLGELLADLGRPADILLGKPLPAAAARRLLGASPQAAEIHWLIDSPARLRAYLELARELELQLSVALEIDVGLRRGGPRQPSELLDALAIIAANRERLRFAGLMGYDGHVPYAVALLGSSQAAVEEEFAAVHERYAAFVEAGRAAQPELFSGPLIFNSGGSRTYYRYTAELGASTPVNEIAMGSGFITPATFTQLVERGHRPALLLATPVLKRQPRAEIPFFHDLQPWLALWDPNLEVDYVLAGGGFPGDVVSPPGLVDNPFTHGDHGVRNLMANQSNLNGSARVELEVGDFVFYAPWEADAMIWCESVLVLRGGRVTDEWGTYRGGP